VNGVHQSANLNCTRDLSGSRGGSTLGLGGAQPPNVGQAPEIFWFQRQKYALLKSRLFLYSGEINTRIKYYAMMILLTKIPMNMQIKP